MTHHPDTSATMSETILPAGSVPLKSPMPVGLRIAATSAPAAAVTFGLFLLMGGLIAADFVPAEASEVREISSITPQEIIIEEIGGRKPAKKLETLAPPPPPPQVSILKADINLPTPQISGTSPAPIRFTRVQSLNIVPVAISDREATPIRPPVVTYPARAIQNGIEGACAVTLDVDVRGKPYNINADCSNAVFKAEAERAVGRVEFAPKLVQGKAAERKNVVYPLVFSFAQDK